MVVAVPGHGGPGENATAQVTTLLDAAIYIATEAHRGDLNPHDGELYVHHPQRVAMAVRDAGYSEQYQAVAWMHDVVEDTDWTLEMVRLHLVGSARTDVVADVILALDAMTHRDGETNNDYYHRIAANTIARAVGFYDKTVENFGRNHLLTDDAKRLRMAQKYSLATSILNGPGPVA